MGVELTDYLTNNQKNQKMFTRAFRQTARYANAFSSVQYRQLNNNNVIIPNFTHFTPIVQQKLDLSTSLVSSLSAEVQQMLMELSFTDVELPEEDETRWVDLKSVMY